MIRKAHKKAEELVFSIARHSITKKLISSLFPSLGVWLMSYGAVLFYDEFFGQHARVSDAFLHGMFWVVDGMFLFLFGRDLSKK